MTLILCRYRYRSVLSDKATEDRKSGLIEIMQHQESHLLVRAQFIEKEARRHH